jgi:formylglycine-generating enzyme required for sulfatase activity
MTTHDDHGPPPDEPGRTEKLSPPASQIDLTVEVAEIKDQGSVTGISVARIDRAEIHAGEATTIQHAGQVVAERVVIESGPLAVALAQEFYRALTEERRAIEPPQGDLSPTIAIKPFEPETVLIPAGSFLMGSAPGDGIPVHQTPLHEVSLPAYRIGKFPVTVREFAAFVKQTRAVD